MNDILRNGDNRPYSGFLWTQTCSERTVALVFANGYHPDSAMEDMLKAADTLYHLIGDGARVGTFSATMSWPEHCKRSKNSRKKRPGSCEPGRFVLVIQMQLSP